MEMHRKSLAVNTELGGREGMASNYYNMGIVLRTHGDLGAARETRLLAEGLFRELGNNARADEIRESINDLPADQ